MCEGHRGALGSCNILSGAGPTETPTNLCRADLHVYMFLGPTTDFQRHDNKIRHSASAMCSATTSLREISSAE